MEDSDIVKLYWKRSERAIGETKTKYGTFCRSVAFRILRDSQDAQECEQDTYLRAWNAMPPQRPSVLQAFLGKIARNAALDRWREGKAEKRGQGQVPVLIDELADCLPDGSGVFAGTSEVELVALLNAFLEQAPREQRHFFVRRYWYGDTVAEIASAYGATESKVKMTLARMREELKAVLTRGGVAL